MRVQLRLELDCTPDVMWEALRTPSVLQHVAHPWLAIEAVSPRGLPRRWPEGAHGVHVSALGLVPLGRQTIDIHYSERAGARIVEDGGGPTTGLLAAVTSWRHRMAVSALPRGRTLYRDRLDVTAGPLTPLVWLSLWAFWQWRGAQLRRLSADWRA